MRDLWKVCPDSAHWVVQEGHYWEGRHQAGRRQEGLHQELLGDLRMVEDPGVGRSDGVANARNAG